MSSNKNNNIFEKTSFLGNNSSEFVETLYADYLSNPDKLPKEWKIFFEGLNEKREKIIKNANGPSWSRKRKIKNITVDSYKYLEKKNGDLQVSVSEGNILEAAKDSVRANMLVRAYRIRGHLISNLDPLGLLKREQHSELKPETYGFSDKDLNKKIFLDGTLGIQTASLKEILLATNKTYCQNIGFEFMHMSDPEERKWIRQRIEGKEKAIKFTENGKKAILNKLIEAEGFEKFLHVKFVGTKRFGLDGGESLIPALEQIIKRGGNLGVKEVKIGMPHRGRLNVLANMMQKPFKAIFKEFFGQRITSKKDFEGDVKYHLGASANREFDGNLVHISLTDNPSHLEAVNPVVLGQVRAKQFFHKDKERKKVVPVLIHGDAAFAGQGVVAECFAMSGLPGHNTGGTIHIIVNNQIGFTTAPRFARSSPYPSDLAKMVQAPIFHVNGDDPEAVVHCAKIATEFRQKFNRDVVIDMVCYRRFGHNEGDEPSFTQPLMYKKIRSHPTTLEIYGKKLVEEGLASSEEIENSKKKFKDFLNKELVGAKDYKAKMKWFDGVWSRFKPEIGQDRRGVTGVDKKELILIGKKITEIPKNFKMHKTLIKLFEVKKKIFTGDQPVDWSTAESLAFATLVNEGFSVRLSGQDSGRGTFSQRHSVLRNQDNHDRYVPLNHISKKQKRFEIIDSLLSELGVLGFEFGYSLSEPETLVLWEAQFGDFSNGAQVVIDQFIASGESKWSRASGLVMLLPHGYEGQGPEHSSARLERFLQLCAQDNLQVVNCTTPANYFHVLRRQMHRDFRKPLIVMTPKSLLRNKMCVSNLDDFTKKNSFHRILEDHAYLNGTKLIKLKKDKEIKKVVICSGKIYFDLIEAREKAKDDRIVFIRIEQLYPFPVKHLGRELKRYKNAEIFWCQEEPMNMGGWNTARHYIDRTLEIIRVRGEKVKYIGRNAAASPATGNHNKHLAEQKEILEKVFSRKN
ncbi:MAG: 2-oxoglutarate dehydrogenase E1 component [Candidatus Marinimicrobia bacterium]|nr:2-oxoglutarate dehydrogenase E1 component [Candidatus Neomarinimicrobiota bacterium]RPG04858.1 MAG: 2-oxoglutarate dehydrogenase E1 component [Pelagibacteraceae bacterium TMED247]|tara:strand:- start:18680 stop:21583 length:2904 start_codon:yes stop_codon:yes gene_type:complete